MVGSELGSRVWNNLFGRKERLVSKSALVRERDWPRHSMDAVVFDARLNTVFILRSKFSRLGGHAPRPSSFLDIVASLLIILF